MEQDPIPSCIAFVKRYSNICSWFCITFSFILNNNAHVSEAYCRYNHFHITLLLYYEISCSPSTISPVTFIISFPHVTHSSLFPSYPTFPFPPLSLGIKILILSPFSVFPTRNHLLYIRSLFFPEHQHFI